MNFLKKYKYSIVCVLALLIISSFFRFYRFTETPGLYHDEAINGSDGVEAFKSGGLKVFYPDNGGREGLFINIQAILVHITNIRAAWVLRLPSAVFGTLGVIGLFFMLYELALLSRIKMPLWVGFMGAFFMATGIWAIILSHIGLRVSMVPFCCTWMIYFFVLALRKESWWPALISGILLGIGMQTYIAFRIVPALFLSFVPFYWKQKKFWIYSLIVAVASIIVASPLIVYFIQNPGDFSARADTVSVFNEAHPLSVIYSNTVATGAMFLLKGDSNWRHNIGGQPELFIIVALFLIVGVGVCIKRHRVIDIFLLWCFVVGAIPEIFSNDAVPHALRAVLMIPAVYGIAAVAWIRIYEILQRSFPKAFSSFMMSLVIVTMLVSGYVSFFNGWLDSPHTAAYYYDDQVQLAYFVNLIPKDTPKYIIMENIPNQYYIPILGQPLMFLTRSEDDEEQQDLNIHYLVPDQFDLIKNTVPQNAIVIHNPWNGIP